MVIRKRVLIDSSYNWWNKPKVRNHISIDRIIKGKITRFQRNLDQLKNTYRFCDKIWNDEILNGIMLSDAHINKNCIDAGNCWLEFEQSEKHQFFVDNIQSHLQDLGFNTGIYKYMHKATKSCKKEYYWGIRVYSMRHKYFTLQRKRWYPNGIKIVPKDLILTPKTLAYWFMGDGTCNWHETRNRSTVELYTCAFSKADIDFLLKSLNNLGINRIRRQKRINHTMGETITIGTIENVHKFFDLVEPYILPLFSYKIKRPKLFKPTPYETNLGIYWKKRRLQNKTL